MADVSVALLNRFGSNTRSFGTNPFKECDTIGQSEAIYRWSFSNSLMYTATLISAIGYGYLFPLTFWGKLSTIAYAMLGIPIMVIFLAAIGDILGNAFRYIYANLCCCVACIRKTVDRKKDTNVQVEKSTTSANGTLKNAIATSKKAESTPWQSRKMGAAFSDVEIDDSDQPAQLRLKEKKAPLRNMAAETTRKQEWIEENEGTAEEDTSKIIDQLQVPVTFLLIIVIAFLLIGVVVFESQGWNMLDCVYFCFISLSTIGFGDYVPDRDQPDTQLLLTDTIAAIVYILVGMAILSMCLNLIQDDLVNKAEWFARKVQYIKGRCCKKSADKE